MKSKFMKVCALVMAAALGTALLAGCAPKQEAAPTATETPAPEGTEAPETTPEQEAENNDKFDVVVIGAGGAGMTAALQAVQNGDKNVVILEKMSVTGGNTTRSTGGLNAAATSLQKEKGIEDSVDLMIEDTIKGGKERNDRELVRVLAENSAAAVDWVNSIGGDLTDVGRMAGASVDRCHRPSGGAAVGPMLVSTLNSALAEYDIPVRLETTATEILVDETGAVKGVRAKDADGEYVIDCTAVIVATGGFGANSEMVVQYNPNLAGFITTNHPGATGDGIVMAIAAGAATVDMDQIQTHPTVEPTSATMYTEAVRGNGAILVNAEGKRFVSELETRDVVSAAILEQTDDFCWLVFDETVRQSLKAIEGYINAGILVEADSVEELAEKIGADPAVLKETIDTYNGYVASGVDEEFGRADMKVSLETPKFYAGKCAPAVHHTMGGLKIDTSACVLNEQGEAIPGLFAAGEVTGGVHGANRLGGNAVADIVVFGRVAADSATAYVQEKTGFTERTAVEKMPVEEEAPAVPSVQGNFTDGTYTGTGKGMGGDLTVTVVVENGSITSITVDTHNETPGISDPALERVPAAIIAAQSVDVDTVSGATMTSNGIMTAVKDALAEDLADAA